MIGDHDVPEVTIGGTFARRRGGKARALQAHVLNARLHQFHAHVDGEENRDEPDERRGDEVQDTDILVVRGHEPPGEEPTLVVVVVAVNGCVCHCCLLLSVAARGPGEGGNAHVILHCSRMTRRCGQCGSLTWIKEFCRTPRRSRPPAGPAKPGPDNRTAPRGTAAVRAFADAPDGPQRCDSAASGRWIAPMHVRKR